MQGVKLRGRKIITYIYMLTLLLVLSLYLLREVFVRVLRFSPLLKNQHFQIQIRSGTHKLLSDPWVNKLQITH